MKYAGHLDTETVSIIRLHKSNGSPWRLKLRYCSRTRMNFHLEGSVETSSEHVTGSSKNEEQMQRRNSLQSSIPYLVIILYVKQNLESRFDPCLKSWSRAWKLKKRFLISINSEWKQVTMLILRQIEITMKRREKYKKLRLIRL